jgi:hypothetical protein
VGWTRTNRSLNCVGNRCVKKAEAERGKRSLARVCDSPASAHPPHVASYRSCLCLSVVDLIDLRLGACRGHSPMDAHPGLRDANDCGLRLGSGLTHLLDYWCPRFNGLHPDERFTPTPPHAGCGIGPDTRHVCATSRSGLGAFALLRPPSPPCPCPCPCPGPG